MTAQEHPRATWSAVGRPPAERRQDVRAVSAAFERFLGTGDVPPDVHPVVADSWRRSLRSGVDPDGLRVRDVLPSGELQPYRQAHPLAAVMPVVRDLVVEAVEDDGLVVAVCDQTGRLLWVEGDRRVRDAAGRVGFVEGAAWGEESVGTNAPGTALALRRPVQVAGAEHFARPVQALSCTAVPVHDPLRGDVLGVLDVTGGSAAVTPVMLSLVRATVASVERELALLAREGDDDGRRAGATAGPAPVRRLRSSVSPVDLTVLCAPRWRGQDAGLPLPLRHAEILLLLAHHPRGLSAGELAVLLHPGELSGVAVRAEISRLRRVVGPLLAGSRPYRLSAPLRTDADVVRDLLAIGDVRGALAAYAGPVLPRSRAPGVEHLRAELLAEVRAAVLAAGDAGALDTWVATDHGADDHTAWTRLARLADPGTPRGARARAHVALLDAELEPAPSSVPG